MGSSARAAAKPVRLPMEPPDTKTPSVPSGSPSICRIHSTTTISTAAGPDPPPQLDEIVLKPVPIHSPRIAAKEQGPGTRAK